MCQSRDHSVHKSKVRQSMTESQKWTTRLRVSKIFARCRDRTRVQEHHLPCKSDIPCTENEWCTIWIHTVGYSDRHPEHRTPSLIIETLYLRFAHHCRIWLVYQQKSFLDKILLAKLSVQREITELFQSKQLHKQLHTSYTSAYRFSSPQSQIDQLS